MYRAIFAIAMLALVVSATGCSMCAHPYDYCGPTFTNECGGDPCDPNARYGSVLVGGCCHAGAEMPIDESTQLVVAETEPELHPPVVMSETEARQEWVAASPRNALK